MVDDGRHSGRNEILAFALRVYGVSSWRTIRRWRKYYAFPIRTYQNGIPYILTEEVLRWEIAYQQAEKEKNAKVRRLSTAQPKENTVDITSDEKIDP